jgi:hypothetical protein
MPLSNARWSVTAPARQVVASVVMCGCPIMTPFGWVLVWRAVLQPVPATARAVGRNYDYLEKLATPN